MADPSGFNDQTGEVSPGGWMSTAMGCSAEGLMDQDAFFLAFLQSGPTVQITGDQLTLAGGGIELRATRQP